MRLGCAASVLFLLCACSRQQHGQAPWLTALGRADHGKFFPIAAGSHAPIDCNSCHGNSDTFREADCTSCHTPQEMRTPAGRAFHESVPDVTPASASAQCLLCHGDGTVPVSVTISAKAPTHDAAHAFRISPGALHSGQACLTCHSLKRAGPALPAADFAQQTCTACHAPSGSMKQDCDALHAAVGAVNGATYVNLSSPPVPADSKTCLKCHADGGVLGVDHAAFFPIAAGSSHQVAGCASCHQDPANRQGVTCSTCHTPAGTNASGPAAIDLVPAHLTRLAGSNWKAPSTPTVQCLLCHAQDLLTRVATHGAGASGEHPGVTFFIDAGGHFAACEKCHAASVTGPSLKNPSLDFSKRTCDACHGEAQDKLVTVHGLIGVTVADTTAPNHASQCMTCHPDGRAAPATIPYTHAEFPVGASSTHPLGSPAVHAPGVFACASCHAQLSIDPKQIDCTTCHTQAQMTPAHASVPDLAWLASPQARSLACLRCHADGRTPAAVTVSTTAPPHDATYTFRVSPGAVHGGQACLACHSVAQPIGATGASAADFTQQTCTACHLPTGTLAQDIATLHAGVTTPSPGFVPIPNPVTPAYSKTCLVCHADGQINAAIAAQNHGNFFPIAAAGSHAYGKGVTVAGAALSISCAACHVDSSNRPNVNCTACHIQSGNGTPSQSVPADQTVAHSGKVATAPHNLWLGTGPVGAGSGASARCLSCHAADTRPKGFVAVHGLAGPAATVFAIGATSKTHYVSCDQCHTAMLTSAGRQNPEYDFSKASCDACHAPASTVSEHAGFGSTVTGYGAGDANNAAACLSCHPTGGTATGFTHAWFPIGESDVHSSAVSRCADCHANAASYSGPPAGNTGIVNCTGCHSNASAVHSPAGIGIWDVPGGMNYTDNSLCLKCHAGNIGGAVAAFSTPLLFRLAQHDQHCLLAGKNLISGDPTHNVNRNADNGVPICFACHDALTSDTTIPWATEWAVASPSTSCIACHQHQLNPAPNVTCR